LERATASVYSRRHEIAYAEVVRAEDRKPIRWMITLRNEVGQEGGCLRIDGECPELQGDLNETMYNRKREIEDCESRECDASPLQRIDYLNKTRLPSQALQTYQQSKL
jgi:hypothetical protein